MVWKSDWTPRAPAPVVGYTLIGFFGPVVSLIISIGMANVAGATKKSCTAAAIFVAYCVGNVCLRTRVMRYLILTIPDYRAPAHQDADLEATLPRAVAWTYHLVCMKSLH